MGSGKIVVRTLRSVVRSRYESAAQRIHQPAYGYQAMDRLEVDMDHEFSLAASCALRKAAASRSHSPREADDRPRFC